MMQDVPPASADDKVATFMRLVVHDLDHLDPSSYNGLLASLSDLRQVILQIQKVALQTTARQWDISEEILQVAIQNSSSTDRLNRAARRAFCRVALAMDWDRNDLKTTTPTDSDTLEFLGLMITAHDEDFIARVYSKDQAQQVFWKALGYDPIIADQALRNRFHGGNNNHDDEIMLSSYQTMISKLQDDGVTRVVAVQYSEFNTDGTTVIEDDAVPRTGTMDRTATTEPLVTHQQMEMLRHKLKQEIQSMQKSERDTLIQQARDTAQSILAKLSQPELSVQQRMLLLTSLDEETQRLMIINKLWQEDAWSSENV